MSRQRRGVTLMETLVTLWMIGIMLLMVAQLARNIQQESVHNKDHDQRMGAHQALERLGQALRSSHRILEPAANATSNRLRLESWNASANSGRLPNPPATTGLWTPNSAAYLFERRFEVGGDGVLLCTTLAGTTDTIRLLGDLSEFRVSGQGDGTYRLELRWVDSKGKARQMVRWSAVMPI